MVVTESERNPQYKNVRVNIPNLNTDSKTIIKNPKSKNIIIEVIVFLKNENNSSFFFTAESFFILKLYLRDFALEFFIGLYNPVKVIMFQVNLN